MRKILKSENNNDNNQFFVENININKDKESKQENNVKNNELRNLINVENGITNNINNEQKTNTESDEYKKKL